MRPQSSAAEDEDRSRARSQDARVTNDTVQPRRQILLRLPRRASRCGHLWGTVSLASATVALPVRTTGLSP